MIPANNKELVDEISKPRSDKASVLVFHPRGKRINGAGIHVVKIDRERPAVFDIVLCKINVTWKSRQALSMTKKTLLRKPGRSPVSFSVLVHHGVSGFVAEGLEAGSKDVELCPEGNSSSKR